MNKVALQLFLQGKEIEIYFYETEEYKNVERDLLQRINTKYNQKNNKRNMGLLSGGEEDDISRRRKRIIKQ